MGVECAASLCSNTMDPSKGDMYCSAKCREVERMTSSLWTTAPTRSAATTTPSSALPQPQIQRPRFILSAETIARVSNDTSSTGSRLGNLSSRVQLTRRHQTPTHKKTDSSALSVPPYQNIVAGTKRKATDSPLDARNGSSTSQQQPRRSFSFMPSALSARQQRSVSDTPASATQSTSNGAQSHGKINSASIADGTKSHSNRNTVHGIWEKAGSTGGHSTSGGNRQSKQFFSNSSSKPGDGDNDGVIVVDADSGNNSDHKRTLQSKQLLKKKKRIIREDSSNSDDFNTTNSQASSTDPSQSNKFVQIDALDPQLRRARSQRMSTSSIVSGDSVVAPGAQHVVAGLAEGGDVPGKYFCPVLACKHEFGDEKSLALHRESYHPELFGNLVSMLRLEILLERNTLESKDSLGGVKHRENVTCGSNIKQRRPVSMDPPTAHSIPPTTSLRSCTLSVLKEYEESGLALLASLQLHCHRRATPSTRRVEPPEDIINRMIATDHKLQMLFNQVVMHQETQSKLDTTLQQIEQHNVIILSLVRRLQSAQNTLDTILSDAGDKLATLKRASQDPLDYKSIISYARRVANRTSGPPSGPGLPPIPQEVDLKASRLFWSPHDLIDGKEEPNGPGVASQLSNAMDVDAAQEEDVRTPMSDDHGVSHVSPSDLLDLDL
ncbi:hypothetical protein SeMB42_g05513 [Synchytrium endobioticum]|uniref:Mediator of RNA polymerase II transcription subunit 4 n=1 Tax=Synchytrium endobioticum TaxID=286115 RepID=A0A507CQZ2_9FUNG|nr:hypothetical protein SeLEV6574_g07259 [Synchytrium endobioticum]TPX41582.1 hypothetical protein SeMB42_g05513 [Synchytrium endobioticum]